MAHRALILIKSLILEDNSEVYVSAAAWWEIAIKTSIGKLDANLGDLRAAAQESGFLELPVLGIHAEELTKLPMRHKDPIDRMIVAQAMSEPMRLLTGDQQLVAYSDLVHFV